MLETSEDRAAKLARTRGLVRGDRRMREIGAADEAARQAEVAAILQDFGRAPSYAERLLIGELAAQVVRGRRMRRLGKAKLAADCSRLISRIANQLGLNRDRAKPTPPAHDPAAFQRAIEARGAAHGAAVGAPLPAPAPTTASSPETAPVAATRAVGAPGGDSQ